MGAGRIRYRAWAMAAALALVLCAGCAPVSETPAEGGLEPGIYRASVELQGGTGKAAVASPAQLDVAADGSLMATVVWSSSHYDLMVVDGENYLPTSVEGGSTFEIPVARLGEALPVQAETTAMGTPHLIDYTLRFDLDAFQPNGGEGDGSEAGSEPPLEDEGAGGSPNPGDAAAADPGAFRNVGVGTGMQPVRSMPLQYATQFTVDYFEDGSKLLCLSDGARYLVLPEGVAAPTGLSADVVVLRQPIGDVYLAASDAMCLFDALDALDAVTVSGIARDSWAVEAAVRAMDEGRMAYGGKYSMPDYDTLLAKGCRLAIESTMVNHTPEVRDKLVELGIPVLTERSSYEGEPLGRAEWVKLYGALLDQEDEAERLFAAQVEKAGAAAGADTGKSVAYFYVNSNGAAVVRRPGDYVARMIELAGGRYAFSSLEGETAGSTVTLEMERFYAEAKDADVIVYNATIDSGVESLADLVAKNGLLADFKAVQSGEVWVTRQNMYQQMMSTGDIIADFAAALRGDGDGLTYLERLE